MSVTHGWTTWDPASIAVWEHLPSGVRCQLILEDEQGNQLAPATWEPLEETLPDAAGRSFAHFRLAAADGEVEVECGGQGDLGACRISHVLGDHLSAHWDISGSLAGWQVRRGEYDVAFAPEEATLPEDVAGFLSEQRELALRAMPQGEWQLAAPLAAMEATVAANTFTLPKSGDVVTVSRHQMETTGEWRLPNWQTFLTALGIAYIDPQLAIDNVRTAMRLLTVNGILGAESTSAGVTADLSNPPVAAYAIWKIVQMTGEFSLIDEFYPTLLHWHDWWWNARDGNQNHLLNWASEAETGMPGHPLYTSAPTDAQTGIMRVDDVALCSLWALDAFALMRMALQINDIDQATHLETELNSMAARLNLTLWDARQRIFRSRDWDGYETDRQSATVFLTLIGGVPTHSHMEEMLNRHLTEEFDTPFLVATLGKGDQDFDKQLPWCGRVSPLLNSLICEGLRQFGRDDLAETITLSGLKLISNGWKEHQVFDSYHAITGRGDDIAQDPLAPTGILFGALGIAMLMDAEPWNGLRMGNLHGIDMAINGFHLHGDTYDLASGPWGFSASRNEALWVDWDTPAIMRNLTQTDREISCGIKLPGGGPIHLRFHGYEPGKHISIKVNGQVTRVIVNAQGIAECTVEVATPHGGFGIRHRAA